MDELPGRFLRTWLLSLAALSTSVCLFEILMDPYLLLNTPKIVRINLRKPSAETQVRLMRAYDVLRVRPTSLILGSSRAAWGLDGDDESWPAETRPVYNLAVPSETPEEAYQYLRYVMASHPVSFVYMGLEFGAFLQGDLEQDIYHPHPSVAAQTDRLQAERDYIGDVLRFSVSLDALTDSSRELLANLTDPSWNLDAGGWRFPELQQDASRIDPDTLFAYFDLLLIGWYRGRPGSDASIQAVEKILELCRSHHTRLVLFISPSHADDLELLHFAGQWPAFENWERELVRLSARYDPHGDSVQIWDFSNYDEYSTESPIGGRQPMRWFWNSSHYSRALGAALMQRLFGKGDPHFGKQLSAENVEAHLAQITMARQQYLEQSPDDVHRLRGLVARAP